MSYITTVTGKHFDPMDPGNQEFDIIDIAHALSLICRGNGHIRFFYSVAQHSIACAEEAIARGYSKNVVLGCLLHDGSEAYLADITRPVKKHLHKYLEVEEVLQNKIFEKWIPTLSDEERKLVFEIDDAILYYEFTTLFGESIFDYVPILKSNPRFDYIEFSQIENEFITKFNELIAKE